MIPRIHSTKAIVTLLIAAVTIAISDGTPGLAHAFTDGAPGLAQAREKADETAQPANHEKNRKKIRKEIDEKLKAREPLYPRQAESLSKQYKETAAIVARQGGDPRPLLEAAAYFESQSE